MTPDEPAPGLVVWQPKRGFRYGAEAFWLVGFALEGGRPDSVVDLGTGSGIMAFLLARQGCEARGVDIRPEWLPFWERTLADSSVASPPVLELCPVQSIEGQVDLVVSNPPYFVVGAGPVSPDPFKAAARSETQGTLQEFQDSAVRLLKPGGRATFVVPVERLADVESGPGNVSRLAFVGRRRVLVELRAGPVDARLVLRVAEGDEHTQRWYALAQGT